MSTSLPVLGVLTTGHVVPARAQMGFTLGFHIILACFGIALPTIVLVAEYLGLKRSDEVAMTLARRWSQVMGVLVVVGAVTGTVLSFEMGLLWPGLMKRYGSVVGLPFALEGIFFFLEAIFTAIYLYGWRRLRPWAHFWSGVPIAISGIFGALSVIAANSWMNQPGGFTTRAGRIVSVDPLKVFFNHAAYYEMPHMLLAAYLVAGFGVASVYAVGYLRGRRDRYHRLGFAIPFVLAAALTPVQFLVGDTAARAIAKDQPVKFAAMEYVTHTSTHVPEVLGGIYIRGRVYGGLPLPGVDSLLVGYSTATKVIGLTSVPPAERPPIATAIHLAFDVMVGLGSISVVPLLWLLVTWWRRRVLPTHRWFWLLAAGAGPGAVIAMECGWIVTEIGRQPWVVYRLLRTSQAVTINAGVVGTLTAAVIGYAVLGVSTVLILRLLARRWHAGEAPATAPSGTGSAAGAVELR